jgi:hypothetical protein
MALRPGFCQSGIHPSLVMSGLVPGIHAFLPYCVKDVDGRDKPGHDEVEISASIVSDQKKPSFLPLQPTRRFLVC